MATKFMSCYMELRNLQFDLSDDILLASYETIKRLKKILKNKSFSTHRCSYFLYRLAVEILAYIIGKHPESRIREKAYISLKEILFEDQSTISIPIAEALSNLPLNIKGPQIKKPSFELEITTISKILNKFNNCNFLRKNGRSLLFKIDSGYRILVLKLEKTDKKAESLQKELLWLFYLKEKENQFEVNFSVPEPVDFKNRYLFYLKDQNCHAISFLTTEDYFRYPNHPPVPSKKEFLTIMSKASYIFGKLASFGIVHTDPIPLFHNRTEAYRRDDRGIYLWTRGGRLDRWLESCKYPNFSLSGVRDFEHFISFSGTNRELFRLLGNHFLAMFLVLGSYFRAKEPLKVGFQAHNRPYDVRYLFDKDLMKTGINEILRNYFRGFVGESLNISLKTDLLVERMVEEMGVDRHMEELLRVQDQVNMTDQEFKLLLLKNGYKESDLKDLKKGKKDVVLYTGPHLGEFNGRISIPELLNFTAVCTAVCLLHKSLKEINVPKFLSGCLKEGSLQS